MTRDRLIQLMVAAVLVISLSVSGALLPGIVRQADDHVLRYTDVSVEGAPPWVAIGTAIGALRGLIVDILWIKVNAMKEQGLYYEVMADADLITKLQPRFAKVWAFHGHNMAYNISVATHTQEERWEWVNAGIRLVRNEGLRYNPNNLELHRELAFWFAHKIEGVADDAHLYYKTRLAQEWHLLLGEPPDDTQARIAWIKAVADAPETLEAAEQRTPGVMALVQRLTESYKKLSQGQELQLNRGFLGNYQLWQEVTQRSAAARILGVAEQYRREFPTFLAFDELAGDPALQEQWKTLIAHVRKRVLKDEYNMDPQLMYEYTSKLGPIDWRHGQAHALYWSRRGSQFGESRIAEEDRYIVLNNDSAQMQAMQDLARWGNISYDPFSSEQPSRFPEPRWIDAINDQFGPMYLKHINLRGAGGERFITFLQNFMSSAVREWYRAGEVERARAILDRLDSLFGSGLTATNQYKQDLDVFVWNQTRNQYEAQPHVAPSDVAAGLRYGFKMGMLHNRPDVLRNALVFAKKATDWFRGNVWNDYITKFGSGRIKDLLAGLEDSAEIAYLQLMADPSMSMQDRITIWSNTDRVESEVTRRQPELRAMVYDRVMPTLQRQFLQHELSSTMTLEEAFPAPPGLEAARQRILERQKKREQEAESDSGDLMRRS